jgi:CotH kinase protein
VLTNVSLRYKGNSSFKMTRQGWKRPFKLDFNRAHPGREFEGETALFLNPNANDVSQIREALAYDACRAAGLPSPRTAFARVFLTIPGTQTDRYLGLYTVVEAVDNRFLREHFGTADGLLLKPERLPTLQYLGEDWSAYTNRYDPKTKARSSETARFIATTRLIQQADAETLKRELPTRVDLVSLLRYVALQALLANYDSFVGNGHNYYLFQPAREGADGRAVWIPWDLNEAFGGHPPGGARSQQAGFAILHPQANPNRLIDRVLADPAGAAAYRAEVERLLAGSCAPERLVALAARFATLVEPAIREESAAAHAQFQRVALARTNLPPAAPRRGPGFFPDPGRLDDLPLPAWIRLRLQNVREELDGARTAPAPRLTGFGAPRRPPEAPEPGRGRVPPRGPGPSESTDAPSP